MSGTKEIRTTNLQEMFLLENKSPFPMIAEHQEIERNEGIDVRSLSILAAALKRVDPFNAEEIQICLTEIRKGKCQRQKSAEMLAFWGSLRASVQCLSQQKLANLVLTLLLEVEKDERKMHCDCAMRKQKRDYFTKICFLISKLLLEARGNDNRFENENMLTQQKLANSVFMLLNIFANSQEMQCECPKRKEKSTRDRIVEICELFHKIIQADDCHRFEEQNFNLNMNLDCCEGPSKTSVISPTNSFEETTLEIPEEYGGQLDEGSSSSKEETPLLIETKEPKACGGKKTKRPRKENRLRKRLSSSEEEPSLLNETKNPEACGENKTRKENTRKKSSLSSNEETSFPKETKKPKACGEDKSKTPPTESTLRKGSLSTSSTEEASLLRETKKHEASGQKTIRSPGKESALSKVWLFSEEETSSFQETKKHVVCGQKTTKKPQGESTPSKGSLTFKVKTSTLQVTKKNVSSGQKTTKEPQKKRTLSKGLLSSKEERSLLKETKKHDSCGEKNTKRPQKEMTLRKDLLSSEKETSMMQKTKKDDACRQKRVETVQQQDSGLSMGSLSSGEETSFWQNTRKEEACGKNKTNRQQNGLLFSEKEDYANVEGKTKTPHKKSLLSKGSLSSDEEPVFPKATKKHEACGEKSCKRPEQASGLRKMGPLSSKEGKSLFQETKTQRVCEENTNEPQRDITLSKHSSFDAEKKTFFMQNIKAHESRGEKKAKTLQRQSKVSVSSEEETDFLGDVKIDGAYGGQTTKKLKKDSRLCKELPVTSPQTSCSVARQRANDGNPEQDKELSKFKAEKNRLKVELVRTKLTKEKHNQEMEVITKGNKKLMKRIEKLEAKILKLENMKRMLFMQTQHQLEKLQEYEAMDVRRPNIILETLENPQWTGLSNQAKEIIDYYQELVANLYRKIDVLTRGQDMAGRQEL